MFKSERTFFNELHNLIYMAVVETPFNVTVHASGPTSKVQHAWTLMEATALHEMLGEWIATKKERENN